MDVSLSLAGDGLGVIVVGNSFHVASRARSPAVEEKRNRDKVESGTQGMIRV